MLENTLHGIFMGVAIQRMLCGGKSKAISRIPGQNLPFRKKVLKKIG